MEYMNFLNAQTILQLLLVYSSQWGQLILVFFIVSSIGFHSMLPYKWKFFSTIGRLFLEYAPIPTIYQPPPHQLGLSPSILGLILSIGKSSAGMGILFNFISSPTQLKFCSIYYGFKPNIYVLAKAIVGLDLNY